MNVLLTHAKMVPHVMTKLMGITAPVWMDTMELTVNQVFIKLYHFVKKINLLHIVECLTISVIYNVLSFSLLRA